jgi:hypothetical protein
MAITASMRAFSLSAGVVALVDPLVDILGFSGADSGSRGLEPLFAAELIFVFCSLRYRDMG